MMMIIVIIIINIIIIIIIITIIICAWNRRSLTSSITSHIKRLDKFSDKTS